MEFSYVNPTQIYFGQGKIASVTDAIPSTSKVLVISSGGSIKKMVFINKYKMP
jgi:NADP-dependent alcohol dehydrogenase